MTDNVPSWYGLSDVEAVALGVISNLAHRKSRIAEIVLWHLGGWKEYDHFTVREVGSVLKSLKNKGIIQVVDAESLHEIQRHLERAPSMLGHEGNIPHVDAVDFTFYGGDLFDRMTQKVRPTQPLMPHFAWIAHEAGEKLPLRRLRRHGTIIATSEEAALRHLIWMLHPRILPHDFRFSTIREIGYIRDRWWQPRQLGRCFDFDVRFDGRTEAENIHFLNTLIHTGLEGVRSSWYRLENYLKDRTRYTEVELARAVEPVWPELVRQFGWRDTLLQKIREGLIATERPVEPTPSNTDPNSTAPNTAAGPPHDEPWFD